MKAENVLTKTQSVLLKRLIEAHESEEIQATVEDVLNVLGVSRPHYLLQIHDDKKKSYIIPPPPGPPPRKATWWRD